MTAHADAAPPGRPADQRPPDPRAIRADAAIQQRADAVSITDFLTDGSLARLCAELSALTGVDVCLRDERGARIVAAEPGGWRVEPPDLAPPEPAQEKPVAVPLMAEGRVIGSLVIGAGQPRLPTRKDGSARATLERTLELLASTASEMVENELALRHRVIEVSALLRMSSLLSRAASVDRVLEVAMDLALSVLQLDAGSVVLFEDDGPLDAQERDVTHKVVRNLSRDWIECPLPLSKDRLFDHMAVQGQVVAVEDLQADDRVQIPDRARDEGLASFINAGLIFQDRALGVIRLYSRTRRAFTDSERRLLKSLAQQAAVSIEQARLLRLEEEERRIARQLELAADVQRRMLPKGSRTSVPGLDVAARYVPSSELGGDFYDFVDLGGHLGVVVGDVVGKGVAAALLMSAVRAMLRAQIENVYDLDEVIRRVNVALCRDTRESEFVSLWYGVIDPQRMRLTYCSAGHEPTFVVHMPKDGKPTPANVTELSIGGMVIGIDESQRYQRGVMDLKPGDVLLAYTDGLTDARDTAGKKLGRPGVRDALLRVLAQNPGAPAPRLAELLHEQVRQHTGPAPRVDDETFVIVRVDAPPHGPRP